MINIVSDKDSPDPKVVELLPIQNIVRIQLQEAKPDDLSIQPDGRPAGENCSLTIYLSPPRDPDNSSQRFDIDHLSPEHAREILDRLRKIVTGEGKRVPGQ